MSEWYPTDSLRRRPRSPEPERRPLTCADISGHVFTTDTWPGAPFCDCGGRRNPAYRRSVVDRLLGRPKR